MKIRIFILFLLFSLSVFGQRKDNKWTATLAYASAFYSLEDATELKSASAIDGNSTHISIFPRISIARYITKGVTLVASISTTSKNVQDYTSIDGELRYDFGTSEEKFIPYVVLGISSVEAEDRTQTYNFGAGSTLWLNENIGIQAQASYRYSGENFINQRSHIFGSAGLVFRFSDLEGKSNSLLRRGCYN